MAGGKFSKSVPYVSHVDLLQIKILRQELFVGNDFILTNNN